MEKYSEIVTKSLIDFEEIKLILANNNIKLVNSYRIKERYFLKKTIKFNNVDYKKVIENSYILASVNDKLYLGYSTKQDSLKTTTKIEILNKNECVNFLNHIGYERVFAIEKDVYVYQDGEHQFKVINMIGTGTYLSVSSEIANIKELKETLKIFKIPYDKSDYDVSIEKLYINKIRGHIKWKKN